MSVHWFAPFSWDHSIMAIAPVIFYVEIITSGKMLTRSTGRNSQAITSLILFLITIYALLYGVRYTYILYFSSLGFLSWLILLHIRESLWNGTTMIASRPIPNLNSIIIYIECLGQDPKPPSI
ncbi:1995_t:CDS:2 [Scutellospora calospora]|uniref:1995_t:CDS:1 n=1 Tax=Scutellospora calospora TaxID=85575 RepID=A0ACA9LH71_9GLOM|nr:1995_t:CDS:2 [Scutellospora calospora]